MNFDILTTLKTIPAAFIGLTVHEYSYALMGYRLGDSTAKEQGRLTLNPLKHIDPIGLIMIENRAGIEILPTSSIVSFITKTCISIMGFN
jgi:Zn-dependent protease